MLTIEPFENALRENTPLTSISDPKALVEYLNQVNLKGDMVLDELKRVSSDRDTCRQKLGEAEKSAKDAWDEVAKLRSEKDTKERPEDDAEQDNHVGSDDENAAQSSTDEDPLGATNKSPPTSIKSPTVSVRGMSLFSPKAKQMGSPKLRQGSEDLFSYDDEVPRLETSLKDRQHKINSLENEVKSLKGDLAVTRESTQSMVQTLEEATRELNGLRDSKDRSESELIEQRTASEELSEQLRTDLKAAEEKLQRLEAEHSSQDPGRVADLQVQLSTANQELEATRSNATTIAGATAQIQDLQATISNLESEVSNLQKDSKQSEKRIETLNNLVATLRSQLTETEEQNEDLKNVLEKSSKESEDLEDKVKRMEAQLDATSQPSLEKQPDVMTKDAQTQGHTATGGKKKNKKKKKTGNSSGEHDQDRQSGSREESSTIAAQTDEPAASETLSKLQDELRQLKNLLEEKDAAIERIHGKLKDQDGLREEIDTLRDDLVNVGQEHVEAKDRVKELIAEKTGLESTVANLEKEVAELHGIHASDTAGTEQKHNELVAQFEDLKVKATTLQTDLSAAQQLASSRFKDLNDLRNVLQKAQPEINTLRSEAAEVKSVKEALLKKDAEFKRLDSKHEEMRSELSNLKKSITDKEVEIRSLNQKISQESSNKSKAEDANAKIKQEVQRLDVEKRRANESLDRLSKELEKSREELLSSKTKLKDLEQSFSKARSDSEGMKEEMELKTAQYASAQSLMASMRDQTAEMAMQTKEARERCDSLDEEVAEAHRLLGERSREGETMRRLLADVEGRADARTREMKERMDAAIEERDRAEDEASTAGRRRAREMEDLRNKYRDMERNLKRAEEDKEELEISQRDWKRRREELEHRAGQSIKEVDEVKKAMGELRDALDESERQARDLEKQKAELRRSVEDTQHRLEKLQKSNKVCCSQYASSIAANSFEPQSMADEISKVQLSRSRPTDSPAQSSRSSQDTGPRVGSPAAKSWTPSAALVDAPNGQPPGAMDYVYLKNVLLQFLEQRDKKHQMQLIPVLGMLLHFDRYVSSIRHKPNLENDTEGSAGRTNRSGCPLSQRSSSEISTTGRPTQRRVIRNWVTT